MQPEGWGSVGCPFSPQGVRPATSWQPAGPPKMAKPPKSCQVGIRQPKSFGEMPPTLTITIFDPLFQKSTTCQAGKTLFPPNSPPPHGVWSTSQHWHWLDQWTDPLTHGKELSRPRVGLAHFIMNCPPPHERLCVGGLGFAWWVAVGAGRRLGPFVPVSRCVSRQRQRCCGTCVSSDQLGKVPRQKKI